MQPIKIYNGTPGGGPNPWKTIIVLAELQLPYEIVWMPYGDLKKEPYTSLNPNGRFPAMTDPNTNVTLFESGAIVQYLVARYDKQHLISYGDDRLQEKWLVDSWLMLQMSGQGPTFGQKMWFTHFHKKINVTTAIERYADESKRIIGVVNDSLAKQRKKLQLGPDARVWLVGDKCTYADLSFVAWDELMLAGMFPEGGFDCQAEYPEFYKWHQAARDRPAVRQVMKAREEAMSTMENSAAAVLPKREE